MRNRTLTAGSLLLALVLLFAVNILSAEALRSARLDLTQHHLYTLSKGTRRILSSLKEPITLRLFLSRREATRLPGIAAYATRVRELLRQYQRMSGGKLALRVIDPEPFSRQEDRAVGYGLRGVPLGDDDTNFYFGLVGTSSTDKRAVIPFFSPQRQQFLEYDLTKLVYELEHPKRKVVGVITPLPMEGVRNRAMGGTAPAWTIYRQMTQLFDVRPLGTRVTAIPKDVDVLFIARPARLPAATVYAIDQFVLRGGHALVFLDPYTQADPAGATVYAPGQKPGPTPFDSLLAAWGVKMNYGKVVGDMSLAETVQFDNQGRADTIQYPLWMDLPQDQLAPHDLITSNVGDVVMASPGALQPVKGAGTTFEALMHTTRQAGTFNAQTLRYDHSPVDVVQRYHPGGKVMVLAARLTGNVKTAFPHGPPPAPKAKKGAAAPAAGRQGATKTAAQLKASVTPVNIVVVADTDLLEDRFWVQVQNLLGTRIAVPTAANATFVTNALDNLTGSNDLISIRSRGNYTRPFTRIAAIRERAALRYRRTEQKLVQQLKATQSKLVELQRGKLSTGSPILSDAQAKELEHFRHEMVHIRRELRNVRRHMRQDIESLETTIKVINIGVVPLFVGLMGVAAGFARTRRRRRAPVKRT